MNHFLADVRHDFQRHKNLADRAMSCLSNEEFVRRPAPHVNSVAHIVKHLAGNLTSRWTDFLASDGEKPGRDRDNEFILSEHDTLASLLAAWEKGWSTALAAIDGLQESDLGKSVTIRGEPHRVPQALLRGLTHVAYHTGQILYLARLWCPDSPWLTVPPGQSGTVKGDYLQNR
jgi:uncharacterized damage-inducible protein DinB